MDIAAYDINAFCLAHNISRATYYNLRRAGKAPREMLVGSHPRISAEAAADWRREREAEGSARSTEAA